MKLLDSLLDAIVRLEGDALVMHVGEKPYVVTASSSMNAYRGPLAWGQVELSSRVLTFDAVSSMLGQILPADQQEALTEFGAIEHEIPSPAGVADRFTVVAARGGEDVWVELRRRPLETRAAVEQPPAAVVVADETAAVPDQMEPAVEPQAAPASPVAEVAAPAPVESPAHAPMAVATEPTNGVQPAALESRPDESIVVAIPGEADTAYALDTVPDNAIQIVDDEPQDVPTEEEVDAMLAGTAAALLTSSLPGEPSEGPSAEPVFAVVDDEPEVVQEAEEINLSDEIESASVAPVVMLPTPAPEIVEHAAPVVAEVDEYTAPVVEQASDVTEPVVDHVEPVADIVVEQVALVVEPVSEIAAPIAESAVPESELVPVEEAPVQVEAAPEFVGPAFELSPPTEATFAAAEARASNEEISSGDVVVAAGAPLFSEEAVVAAAVPPPVAEPEFTPIVEAAPEFAWAPADTFAPASIEEPAPVAAETLAPVMPIEEPAPIVAETPVVAETLAPAAPIDEPAPVVSEPPAPIEPMATPVEVVATATDDFAARATVEETPVEAGVGDPEPAAVEEPMPISASTTWLPPVAETPMDVTPELRPTEHTPTDAVRPAASLGTPAQGGVDASEPAIAGDPYRESDHEPRAAVVVPLARTPIKPETVTVYTPAEDAALMHTLRVAAARGASTVYVVAQSKPMLRIDGEIGPLESEPTLTAADVDRLVMELAPPRRRDALQNGPVEWLCDVPEIGRVRCLTFKDHRGPGVLFRMFPPRAISADQLALTPEVQALCQQADGLVLVTGARASGKSTLLNAFVDLINRTRSDHVITIESQIGFVHESRRSFISQRESRGDVDLAASFARAALREDPDVMMIEDLKSPELVMAALEAAESGRLVFASVPAASTIGALERIIEVVPADRRAKVRGSLATSLRGVIAQVLLRRVKGGRVAAREILLNTPAVSQLVLEGKMFQLPVALDSGRRHGMVPLTDSLAAHVREGTVQVDEAYRKALDRTALVAFLKREGIDTSFAERLA